MEIEQKAAELISISSRVKRIKTGLRPTEAVLNKEYKDLVEACHSGVVSMAMVEQEIDRMYKAYFDGNLDKVEFNLIF